MTIRPAFNLGARPRKWPFPVYAQGGVSRRRTVAARAGPAVTNVFRDACRSMHGMSGDADSQERELTVQTRWRDGMVGVVFGNEGPGMPPEATKITSSRSFAP